MIGFAEHGDDYRETWRSLSPAVMKPAAARKLENNFSLSLSAIYAKELCRTLQNFAFRRNANFLCSKFAYENDNENENCNPEGKRREAKVIVNVIVNS